MLRVSFNESVSLEPHRVEVSWTPNYNAVYVLETMAPVLADSLQIFVLNGAFRTFTEANAMHSISGIATTGIARNYIDNIGMRNWSPPISLPLSYRRFVMQTYVIMG